MRLLVLAASDVRPTDRLCSLLPSPPPPPPLGPSPRDAPCRCSLARVSGCTLACLRRPGPPYCSLLRHGPRRTSPAMPPLPLDAPRCGRSREPRHTYWGRLYRVIDATPLPPPLVSRRSRRSGHPPAPSDPSPRLAPSPSPRNRSRLTKWPPEPRVRRAPVASVCHRRCALVKTSGWARPY